MPVLNLLGSFQDPLNLDQGASRLVNVRVVPRAQQEGKPASVRFLGSPGLTLACLPVASPCIAIGHAQETIWSGHANGQIFSGIETGSPKFQGTVLVNTTQPIIRFAEDRTALVITSNANNTPDESAPPQNPTVPLNGTGYTATLTAGVVNAGLDTSINFDPSTCAELNNTAVWSGASNFYSLQDAAMFSAEPLEPATVLASSFATKEARGDKVVDLAVSGLILWPLGSRSLEQWYSPTSGSTDFAFTPYPNSLYSVGLAARLSLAVLRDIIMFVATDRRIWLCTGQSGQPVSPPWVDLLLQQLTAAQLGLLTAYAYGQGGADYYVLTMPGMWTIELAGSTGAWCMRQSPGRLDHAGRCATEHDGGVTFVGLDTGHVCTVNINDATEPTGVGTTGVIPRLMLTPWVGGAAGSLLAAATDGQETRQTYVSIEATSSMGPQAGNIQIDWSETTDVTVNGTVVSPRVFRGARQVTLPAPGAQRAIARNLGSGRRRQFRFQYAGSQAPFTMDELLLNVTPGS